ncbi:MAG: phosphohistidine phosphatase SixA [Synergistaceae bacterium]|jgi:phosphohistidine phosphatase|nr:phosphohistidine phosphatase SixA [Synergistaceae bacterium]
MKLYLVRHGDAISTENDDRRPLSPHGRTEAENAGHFLKRMVVRPGSIYHSTLLRSAETAALIAGVLDCAQRVQERKDLLPDDDTDVWVDELETMSEHCVLIGHLPFLSALASRLLTGSEDDLSPKFPSGSVLCLEREGYGGWILRWFVTSKIIAAGRFAPD